MELGIYIILNIAVVICIGIYHIDSGNDNVTRLELIISILFPFALFLLYIEKIVYYILLPFRYMKKLKIVKYLLEDITIDNKYTKYK